MSISPINWVQIVLYTGMGLHATKTDKQHGLDLADYLVGFNRK